MAISLLPDLGTRTLLMGILNVTPDSFSDGGRFAELDPAIAHAEAMVADGADIVDVGGESTRPGYQSVAADTEIARVLPVIVALAARLKVPISVDTYKAATARAALEAGARIVNDVWGLQREPEIARVAAAFGAPVVVMHNRAEADPGLDVVEEMKRFFGKSIAIALAAGIPESHVILDPGIGFGKTPAQQVEALARLRELRSLGCPLLVGASRKRLIGRLTGREKTDDRLYGTLAAHVAAALAGADIVRVHDVAAHRDALAVADAIRSAAR